MPRVEALGAEISAYCERTGNGSSTYDVCRECHDELQTFPHAFDDQLKVYNGEPAPEDGWGGECEHPPYDDESIPSECAVCGKKLTDEDDG